MFDLGGQEVGMKVAMRMLISSERGTVFLDAEVVLGYREKGKI